MVLRAVRGEMRRVPFVQRGAARHTADIAQHVIAHFTGQKAGLSDVKPSPLLVCFAMCRKRAYRCRVITRMVRAEINGPRIERLLFPRKRTQQSAQLTGHFRSLVAVLQPGAASNASPLLGCPL